MTGVDPEVIAFYERGDEAGRLESLGRLEFARTMALLKRFLPPAPAVVLDVGGGAGAYALPLARRGYEVHLVDPIALHLEQALAAAEADPAAELASARNGALPQADASVEAVLLLGPLYHLTEAAERKRALEEALRVLRPGGVLAAVGISRFASTIDGILRGFLLDPAFEPLVERDVAEGQHRNPDRVPHWFTTAYFHRPEELEREVASAGFDVRALLAVEGPAGAHSEVGELDAWLDEPARREILMRAIARVEAEPSLLGASPHVMAIAIRR
jgi:ubiquinone/menaquinone biosynthesis C-methylase UbiE